MGQVLHGSATTTEAVRRAIQRSQESVRALARRHGISPTTVQKWRRRQTTAAAAMGPKQARSPVLTLEQEAVIVAFRRHPLLPLDACLYALQPTIPALTRSNAAPSMASSSTGALAVRTARLRYAGAVASTPATSSRAVSDGSDPLSTTTR